MCQLLILAAGGAQPEADIAGNELAVLAGHAGYVGQAEAGFRHTVGLKDLLRAGIQADGAVGAARVLLPDGK